MDHFQKRYNLDRNEALHHCTLLVNANIEVLNKVLKSKDPRIETAATRSLRVDVKCLSDIGIPDPTHMDKVRDPFGPKSSFTRPTVPLSACPVIVY